MAQDKFVYSFHSGSAEGSASLNKLLGGKGANLHEMVRLGFPVPPGFTLTTDVCTYFYQNGRSYPKGLLNNVDSAIAVVEKNVGRKFGDPKSPLLVSVRSGARISMPGMMDTILNLGLNDETVKGLAESSQNERFAYDAYRRFAQMYGNVVLDIPSHHFEEALLEIKSEQGVAQDYELNPQALKKVIERFKKIIRSHANQDLPQSPKDQLWGAISAVFQSWQSQRAISYRRIHKIPEDWGTAVNVQAMVFGNMGHDSATGVAFTRDPSTGEKRFFGEYLPNAQGEDVVSGVRTPLPINQESITSQHRAGAPELIRTLEDTLPDAYKDLRRLEELLEKHYRDMQDIEFTIEKGKLYLLQTRSAKRTAMAALRSSIDMVHEQLITKEEAIGRVQPAQIEQLLHPRLDPAAPKKVIATGLPASPGAACGRVVFSSLEAEELRKKGVLCLLVRHETSPEDISGMDASVGILTALGGMTSHAAVVARGMGKPCVAGCSALTIDYERKLFNVPSQGITVREGESLTIDGSTGEVILGTVPMINSQLDKYFSQFMAWVDEAKVLEVRANAETPHDVKIARMHGAQGVGLCRTEHMFFEPTRITAVREMIVAQTKEEREKALKKIFPMQKNDFISIFREMKDLPVTIRLLDPPLHEFLPHSDEEILDLSDKIQVPVEKLRAAIRKLKEFNPMLGHRGCRLGITYPEIYDMQVRAIMEAACYLTKEEGIKLYPEIMIPFITDKREFSILKESARKVCTEVLTSHHLNLQYRIGTMIEIPRAALLANEIAEEAEFFSFGTNDLTQMTLGLSRDDSGPFLPSYVQHGIYKKDPFVTIDEKGVGELIRIACEKGRRQSPHLKIGICGEQGGDPTTIYFCHNLKFNYVSCSPFRVPIARLAAAQASLQSREQSVNET